MIDPRPEVRGRMPAAVKIRQYHWGIVLQEKRPKEWKQFWIALGFAGLLAVFIYFYGRDQLADNTALAGFGLLVGVPFAIVLLFYLPWNRRVVIDSRDRRCVRQSRYFFFPWRHRSRPLTHGQLLLTNVNHVRRDTNQSDESAGIGCLLFFLGPVGALVTGAQILSSIKRIHTPAHALYFHDRDTGKSTLLIFVESSQLAADIRNIIEKNGVNVAAVKDLKAPPPLPRRPGGSQRMS